MADILPRNAVPRIEFFETHHPVWAAHADALGSSPAEIAALAAKTAAARDAFDAQRQALLQARAATNQYHDALRAMAAAGTDVLKKIKAKAATDGPSVYSLAQIDPPTRPSPVGPPGKPTQFTATLTQDGVLTLTWKCPNPPGSEGTVYQIARQLDDAAGGAGADMQILATTGQKKFADTTLPAGTPSVTYQVTALRSTRAGPPAFFTVRLGVPPGFLPTPLGGVTTTPIPAPPKQAA